MKEVNTNKNNIRKIMKDKLVSISPGENVISQKLASFWIDQIDQVDKLNNNWHKKSDMIIKRFRDERSKSEDNQRRMNILWTNFKIMMPALYGKRPIPVIERRFLDKDPVGRLSATILERANRNEIETNGLHHAIKQAVSDYLLPGRGVCWVRYEPEIGEGDSIPASENTSLQSALEDEYKGDENITDVFNNQDKESEKLENSNQQVLSESAPVDYLHFKDFYMFPAKARVWKEVQAVGKKIYVSREEANERFGEEIGEKLTPSNTSYKRNNINLSDLTAINDLNDRGIEIIEIWNKIDRRVYWVSPYGYQYLCDVKDDFLKLRNFFPVPKPISATLTNETMIPVPDYIEYMDQAIQLDEITQRLALLTKACKVVGTYDASNGSLRRMLNEGYENQLLPVDNWAAHSEKGGVKGCISFMPLDEIQKVIETLTRVRQQVMVDLDTITGLSDVVRGTTDSRETLGGIRLKNNNAGTRLSDRQNEIIEFAQELISIVAEVQAKHYSDETLIEQSGIMFVDELQPETIKQNLDDEQESSQLQSPQGPAPVTPGPVGVGTANVPPNPQMSVTPQPEGGNVLPFPQAPQLPTNTPQLPPELIIVQKLTKALELLRKDIPRGYRISIETDSTIFADAAQERQDAIEFITGVTGFMEAAANLAANMPGSETLMGRFLQFGVRKFRTGRDLESSIDDFVAKMEKKAKLAEKSPTPPDPEIQKFQIEMQFKQQEMAHQAQMRQHEMQTQQVNDQRDAERQHLEDQREAQLKQVESQFKEKEFALKEREMQLRMQIMEREHQLEIEKMHHETNMQRQQSQIKVEEMNRNTLLSQQEHQRRVTESEQKHRNTLEISEIKKKEAINKAKQPKPTFKKSKAA